MDPGYEIWWTSFKDYCTEKWAPETNSTVVGVFQRVFPGELSKGMVGHSPESLLVNMLNMVISSKIHWQDSIFSVFYIIKQIWTWQILQFLSFHWFIFIFPSWPGSRDARPEARGIDIQSGCDNWRCSFDGKNGDGRIRGTRGYLNQSMLAVNRSYRYSMIDVYKIL